MKQEPFEIGEYYHVFNRGNNKENIFKEKENYSYFLKLIEKHLLQTCQIFAYCLLPNHFHLLLKINDINDIPDAYSSGTKKIHQPFSNLFNAYSKAINKKYTRTGSLFQEHLHRIKITNETYLRELVLYIHLNPEKHGISDGFKNYPFSSYKNYILQKQDIICKDEILNLFDGEDNFRHCHFQRKVKMDSLKEIASLDI